LCSRFCSSDVILPSFAVREHRNQDRAGVVARRARDGSAEDNLHFEISIGRPPAPPVALSLVAAPHHKGEEEGVERLQSWGSIREITVDLALIQKPARAPDQTPLQAVGHWVIPSSEGSALALLVELPRSAMRGRDTQTLTAVRAAAALRAHGQGGYLGECIQGERTALRQAVHPNGTQLSLTVSLAVMRRFRGIVSTFLTPNWAAAPTGKVQELRGPVPQQRSAARSACHRIGAAHASVAAQQGNAHMIDTLRTRRLRTPDTKVMFSVFYADGRTAYMRVDREAAMHGNLFVMSLGREM
jgi:hypothetical protein